MKKYLLLSFVPAMLTVACFGQVPQGINYQGVFRADNGQPLTSQNILVKFIILKNGVTGDVVYSETHNGFTDAFGLFNKRIGEGQVVFGSFSGIDWGNGTHFLRVEVDPTGTGNGYQLLGTQQFVSVPYALYAEKSGSGGGQVFIEGPGISIIGNEISNTGDLDPTDDLTNTSFAGGDLTGTFNNLQIINNAVGSDEIANGSIKAEDLGSMGASSGQVLKFNGSVWAPGTDNAGGGGNYVGGAGISIVGNTISNTGDTIASDDVTTNMQAGGDLSGTFSNLQIKAGVVGSLELSNMGASSGQVLKYNGSSWAPGTDNTGGTTYSQGDGISISSGGVISSTTWKKSGSDVILATTSNNVGIGTSSAGGYKLKIRHNDQGTGLNIENSDNSNDWEIWAVGFNSNLALVANGNTKGYFNGIDGVYYLSSDKKLKKEISPIAQILPLVMELKPSQYEMIHDNPNNIKSIGFIAQEVKDIFPDLVGSHQDKTGENYLSVNYTGFTVLAIKAIQEQQAIIQALSAKVSELEAKVNDLADKK